MTRTEVIAIIEKSLSSADEATLVAVAELLTTTPASALPRALSARELALLAQSKADFATGHTLSHAEMIALVDDRLARRGVPKSA